MCLRRTCFEQTWWVNCIHCWLHRINQSKDYDNDSFVDSEWSTIRSRHSSILGPYRASKEEDTSFPQYRTVDVPIRSGDIFARSLFGLGHGVGLLNVIGDLNRPAEHRYNGAFIGDVGTITEFGSFAYSFNMFLPSTHPLNHGNTPEDFVPFHTPLSDEDTTYMSDFFAPRTILTTQGIDIIPGDSQSQVRFKSNAREGAVVVLPTGASREDLVNPSAIYPYLKEHAASWYRFYNGSSETVAPDSPTIWVVIGIDRISTWATATFPVRESDVGLPRDFVFNGDNSELPWEGRSGYCPAYDSNHLSDGSQGALFLRVVAISLSPLEWSRRVAYIRPESVECCSTLPAPVVGCRARAYYSVPRLSHFSKRHYSRIPEVTFHPSIPLLHILTLTDQTAQVAVVPDSVWISQLSGRHLTHPEIVQLVRRVINNFDIVNIDGLVTFVPREQKDKYVAYQAKFFQRILPWLGKDNDESSRHRALRNMTKVLLM